MSSTICLDGIWMVQLSGSRLSAPKVQQTKSRRCLILGPIGGLERLTVPSSQHE
jgi:hypothetical protein